MTPLDGERRGVRESSKGCWAEGGGHHGPQPPPNQQERSENKHRGRSVLPEPPRPPPNQGLEGVRLGDIVQRLPSRTAGRTASRPGGTEGQRPAWALGVPPPKELTVLLLPGGGRPPPDAHCNPSPGPQPAVHPADGPCSALHAISQVLRLNLSLHTQPAGSASCRGASLSNRRGDGRPHPDPY